MNKLVLRLAAAALIMGAPLVLAHRADAVAKTATRFATIKGTASAPSNKQCPTEEGDAYANQCPIGPCGCEQIPSATVGQVPSKPPIAGKGTANLWVTGDRGGEVPTTGNFCKPFFGIAELTTTLKSGKNTTDITETLNLVGTNCHHLGSALHDPVSGGFSIAQTPIPSNGAQGLGTFTGYLDIATGHFSITAQGPVNE
jgi:hypothetical protein